MSEPEPSAWNFLWRWSQRKRAARDTRRTLCKDDRRSPETGENSQRVFESSDRPSAFDPATLPPIESITGAADVRVFLAPGVPEDLTRAALRRAWMTDPTIHDFVGMAENQGDFNAPDGVPGFGLLPFTPQLREMVAAVVSNASVLAKPQAALDAEAANETGHLRPLPSSAAADGATRQVPGLSSDAPADVRCGGIAMPDTVVSADQIAPQQNGAGTPRVNRRHGGAVPK